MTGEREHETPTQPAREFNDGWWDTIIDELLEEIDGRREEERERRLGR